jgi:hypothetical protein
MVAIVGVIVYTLVGPIKLPKRSKKRRGYLTPEEAQAILEQAKREYEHKVITADALFFQWDTQYICGQLKKPLRERYVTEREDYQKRALFPLKERYDRNLVHGKLAVATATYNIVGVKAIEKLYGTPYGVDKP